MFYSNFTNFSLLFVFEYFLPYAIFTCIFFLVFYNAFKKKFSHLKIQKKEVKISDYKREILLSIQSMLVYTCFTYAVLFLPIKNYSKLYIDISQFSIAYFVFTVVIYLVIQDTYFYWAHRLMHNKNVFKFVHLAHHRSTNPTPFAAYSFNILEAVAEALVFYLLIFIIPINGYAFYLVINISLFVNIYGHLGFEILPKFIRNSFVFNFMITSVYHNMHHEKFRGNYGLYFRFWDKLMKTEIIDYQINFDKIINP